MSSFFYVSGLNCHRRRDDTQGPWMEKLPANRSGSVTAPLSSARGRTRTFSCQQRTEDPAESADAKE